MRVIIEKDNGEKQVFQDVTDYYLAVRQYHTVTDGEHMHFEYELRSFSHTGHSLREVVKEVTQSLEELQDILREQRHGGSS